FMPTALVAGTLVGWAAGRKPSQGRERERERERARPEAEAVDVPGLAALAPVTALACVLYGFGHARVDGMEAVGLVGGLGAALLFAAAGVFGERAAGRFPTGRLTAGALVFAALGVSFNLALHPDPRAAVIADILQGLALCALAVAATRRRFGVNAW